MSNKLLNRRILLIDDDADDRNYFMEAVREIDPAIEVVTATDGQQAIEMLTTHDSSLPQYIFLDLRMPKVNGKQLLQYIKKQDRVKEIPVIIYTTSREVEESEELKNMGAVHFISKPSDPEEIYYVLSLVLEGRWDQSSWKSHKP